MPTFKPLSSSLALEQLLLTIVRDVSGEVGNLTHRMKLELLMLCLKQLVLKFERRITTFSTNSTTGEDSLILAELLLLACSWWRRRTRTRGSTIYRRWRRKISRSGESWSGGWSGGLCLRLRKRIEEGFYGSHVQATEYKLTMVKIERRGPGTLYLYSKRCFDQNRQTEQQGRSLILKDERRVCL